MIMKRKLLRNQRVKIFTGLALLLLFTGNNNPGQHTGKHTIRGTIHNIQKDSDKKEAVIRLFLLDKDSFHKPYEGIRQKVIQIEEGKSSVDFAIENVKSGTYGLRCYQDENHNGKLDRFLIIPKEPWTLSWKNNEKSIPPKFEDISFRVNSNVKVDLFLED
ncbi:MAG: DUF2141 domain-containing protein [Bacteroidota bacterium]